MEELLARYFSGETTEEETKRVLEWRAAEEKNAKAFLDYKKIFAESSPKTLPDATVLQQILHEDEDQITIVPLWNQKLFRFAAAVLLVLGAVFIVTQATKSDLPVGKVVTEKTTFELPDGSVVTLQKGASLSLEDFEEIREVRLTGKGFFEVERDEERPFKVNTKGAIVRVLGTTFMIDTRKEGSTEVLVASGKVSVSQNPELFGRTPLRIELEAGEMGAIEVGQKGIKKKKIKDDNYIAWATEVLTFNATPLAKVAKTLEEVYDIKVDYDNEVLKSCKLTAKFNQKEPEEIAEIIADTFGMTFQKKRKSIVFSGSGCN